MGIVYKDIKDLPCVQLHHLFMTAGWVKGPENPDMLQVFIRSLALKYTKEYS